jgi:hypothetical protein
MDVLVIVAVVMGAVGAFSGGGAFIVAILSYRYAKRQAKEQAVYNKKQEQRRLKEGEKQQHGLILTKLRLKYIHSHENISPGMRSGIEPLPNEWVEAELQKMGIPWRQPVYY